MRSNVTSVRQRINLVIVMMILSSGVGDALAQDLKSMHNLPTAYAGYTGNYSDFTLVLDERFNVFDTQMWEIGDGKNMKERARKKRLRKKKKRKR